LFLSTDLDSVSGTGSGTKSLLSRFTPNLAARNKLYLLYFSSYRRFRDFYPSDLQPAHHCVSCELVKISPFCQTCSENIFPYFFDGNVIPVPDIVGNRSLRARKRLTSRLDENVHEMYKKSTPFSAPLTYGAALAEPEHRSVPSRRVHLGGIMLRPHPPSPGPGAHRNHGYGSVSRFTGFHVLGLDLAVFRPLPIPKTPRPKLSCGTRSGQAMPIACHRR
jgi:hypothetical protein